MVLVSTQSRKTALHSATAHISHRPSDGEDLQRIPPSELGEYRQSHRFQYPYCLCPLFAPTGASAPTEAAVLIETVGPHSGLYVAKCAKSECGYFGQSSPPFTSEGNTHPVSCIPVLLEQIYSQLGVPGKRYPRRGKF